MFRYVFLLFFSLNFLSANDKVVKTSELELFLFKIGFESLLKDVQINKDKSSLNEKELKTINEKIELIMAELYKNNRVLVNDSEQINTIDNKELENLKKEIAFLKSEINDLKNKKVVIKEKPESISLKKDINLSKKLVETKLKKKNKNKTLSKKMRVATALLAVYKKANTQADVIRKIKRETIIDIEYCQNGWCKLKNENYFVRKFLIKPWKK